MTFRDGKFRRLLLFGIIIFLFVSAAAGAPATGTAIINSVPSGASVYIDGSLKGITPYTSHTITEGDHTVTLTLTGYQDFSSTITVPPGGDATVTFTMNAYIPVTLTLPASGTMIIESVPSGASVYVDGALKGITPFTSTSVPAGDHAIILKMTGYMDSSSKVTIPGGGESHELFTMSSNDLSVSSTPSGASLYVDGILKGTTPKTILAIPTGEHTVLLKMTGYEDFTTTVNVPPGRVVSMASTMIPVSAATPVVTVLPSTSETTYIPVTTIIKTPLTATTVTIPVTQESQQIATEQSPCMMSYIGYGELNTARDGRINCTTVIRTDDRITTLYIKEGTFIIDGQKKPVSEIRIVPVNASDISPDAVSGGSRWAGHAYHYLPDQTSFNPPVLVSFTLSQAEWDTSDTANLTIKETNVNGHGWGDLPTTIDPATRTLSAPAGYSGIIALFSTGPVVNPPVFEQPPADITRALSGSNNGSLPLSSLIPDKYAPLAAVVAGITVSVLGTLASGSAAISQVWSKISALMEKFLGSETIGLLNITEVEKRDLHPSENLTAVLFHLSPREILVIVLSTLGFAVAYILQDRLELKLVTLIIFVCVGGIATILHDLAHKFFAYRAGCITEYQFWSLGTVTMLSTAWLFGNAFAKPSRTLIRSNKNLSPEESAIIKLAGPLMSIGVAVVSLYLIPFGGLFAVAGTAGFSMNLLNCVFSLVPVKPNDGVEIYAWNKRVWAVIFIPMIAIYLFVYLQL